MAGVSTETSHPAAIPGLRLQCMAASAAPHLEERGEGAAAAVCGMHRCRAVRLPMTEQCEGGEAAREAQRTTLDVAIEACHASEGGTWYRSSLFSAHFPTLPTFGNSINYCYEASAPVSATPT